MNAKTIKLYRGISSDEFRLASESLLKVNKRAWADILDHRIKNGFEYPHDLDKSIQALHKNLRLEWQYFTDSKDIAHGYARKVSGLLVELTVPLKDVVDYFELEFQNFGRRKKQFEIVYCVKASELTKHKKKWRLKVHSRF